MVKMKLCFLYVLMTTGFFQTTSSAWLRCYKGTPNEYLVTSLEYPLPILNSSCLDQELPTVIYTFGYQGKTKGPATTSVINAYLATKKRNVILLDWEEEASRGLLGISITYALNAVPNAKTIGTQLGDVLVQFSRSGMNMSRVHLIGHSLGAHLMGYAGRQSRKNGYTVSRITGLDPARALYEGTFAFRTGLDRTSAKFVDIIHSDPGDYGISQPMGTVDFWPNYSEGTTSSQPGCKDGDFDRFTREDLCKHDRSWILFVESLATPTAFPSMRAPNYQSWLKSKHENITTNFMGELTNTLAEGNFFLTTNGVSPFGKGRAGMYPNHRQTRRRRTPLTRFLDFFR